MITLKGTLKQSGSVEYEGKKKTKLWIEHTVPKNGIEEPRLEELYLEGDHTAALPKAGSAIELVVRPYAQGNVIKFAAIALVQKAA